MWPGSVHSLCERWHNWQFRFRQWTLCLSLFERLFGGRALDGYFVVQIQSPFLPNSSWVEADRNWSDTSSISSTAEFCETPYFYRPEPTSLPVDAGSRGNVC